jgi:hypothetical protein
VERFTLLHTFVYARRLPRPETSEGDNIEISKEMTRARQKDAPETV